MLQKKTWNETITPYSVPPDLENEVDQMSKYTFRRIELWYHNANHREPFKQIPKGKNSPQY